MIEDYKIYPIRPAAVLTGSYVAATVIGDPNIIYEQNQLALMVYFTIGSLTSAQLKIEFSHDGVTYVQETIDSVDYTTGVITQLVATREMTGSSNIVIPIPIKFRYIKVSVKGTGTVTNSSMTINAMVGIVQ